MSLINLPHPPTPSHPIPNQTNRAVATRTVTSLLLAHLNRNNRHFVHGFIVCDKNVLIRVCDRNGHDGSNPGNTPSLMNHDDKYGFVAVESCPVSINIKCTKAESIVSDHVLIVPNIVKGSEKGIGTAGRCASDSDNLIGRCALSTF